jgi:hypothetical protein
MIIKYFYSTGHCLKILPLRNDVTYLASSSLPKKKKVLCHRYQVLARLKELGQWVVGVTLAGE